METKQCNKCNEVKSIDEFAICKRNTGGRQYQCKRCKVNQIKNSNYKHQKNYNISNKANQRKYISDYYHRHKSNPILKLSRHVRYNIWRAIKNKNFKSETYLECSWAEFKEYIENKFIEGMTWDNYGDVWEVDHIKGICNFDLTDIEQQKQCFHYSNLQPLFKTTEIAKQYGSDVIGNRNKSKK
jgi:hypothetical protein